LESIYPLNIATVYVCHYGPLICYVMF